METKTFQISEDKKQRLDVFLAEELGRTRNSIKVLIDKDLILVNDKKVKAGTILKTGDKITVTLPDPKPTDVLPEQIDLDIVYEDDDLLVINKKQGMVVHPSKGFLSGTLVNALLFSVKNLSGINGELRPGIVHRLDKDTSGLMLVAKNDDAHNSLAKQIQNKTCVRKYLSLLCGNVKKDQGNITTQIGRNPKDRKKMAVVLPGQGRTAISTFVVLERFKNYSFVEWTLQTGRTHQIRVHAKHMGHPVACDPVYGKSPELGHEGQLLHSYSLEFDHPTTKKRMKFEIDVPDYFKDILKKLKNSKI